MDIDKSEIEMRQRYITAAIKLSTRFSRYYKLTQLNAPKIIVDKEQELVSKALTEFDLIQEEYIRH